jgi:haloalkane dehalogenase
MIPPVAAAGLRVLAPDLIGFGKSDKPAAQEDYSYAGQVAWMRAWLEALDLRNITLVCQDWGSLIGLRLAAEMPERFAQVVLGNGGLPTEQTKISPAFHVWRAFSRYSPVFPIGWIVQGGVRHRLSKAERTAYDAPFPSAQYKAAVRVYPSLVPVADYSPEGSADNQRAWAVFEHWNKPFICCFSSGDRSRARLIRSFCAAFQAPAGSRTSRCAAGTFCRKPMHSALPLWSLMPASAQSAAQPSINNVSCPCSMKLAALVRGQVVR